MSSKTSPLEKRVKVLEDELLSIKKLISKNGSVPWWQQISGAFANDPVFHEIDKLGQQIRQKQKKK